MIKNLQAFAAKYPVLTSAIHTFVATFLVTFFALLSQIPSASVLSPATWTWSAISALLVSAVRAAVKAISPLVAPVLE